MTSGAVQSLLLWVQQLEASSTENVALHQRIADLKTQAHQSQNPVAAYQKLEAKHSRAANNADVTKPGSHKRKQSCKAAKPENPGKRACKTQSSSSSSLSSALELEYSDSEVERHTETLLSTFSWSRQGTPKSGRLVPPFATKKETWTVWFAQFEALADDNKWSEFEKLSVLLPKLQGAAGKYVFEVLSQETRSDYKKLV